MNRSKNQQLTDVLIGEAVLSLLAQRSPVNVQTLVARLRAMAAKEQDAQRRDALNSVIADIAGKHLASDKSRTASGNRQSKKIGANNDNIYPLFGSGQSSGASKKH
ncbi:TPA: hypothetical protein ACIPUI_000512 [Citrobacter freundii]